MAAGPKFKVKVEDLIRDLEVARERSIARYEEDIKAYPEKRDTWLQDSLRKIDEARETLVSHGVLDIDKDGWRSRELSIDSPPEDPGTIERYTCEIDERIAYLRRIATPTISIDQETYMRWTGKKSCG